MQNFFERGLPWIFALAMIGFVQSAGAQFNYVTNNGAITITKYTGSGGEVTIPNATNGWPVVSIGTNAFQNSGVTSVTIPNSITNIGNYGFGNCNGLTNITIPNSVTTIGDYALYGCTSLTNVTTGNGITSIGSYAFYWCSGLTSFVIPNSVTNIGSNAFIYCTSLTNITIPGNVISVQDATFYNCTSLATITLDYGVISIGHEAFESCTGLTSVTIPNTVTSIGPAAFIGCSSLLDITVPSSITNIGASAFSDCRSLTAITVDAQNAVYSSANGALFDKSQTTLVEYPNGAGGSYTVPNSVTIIGDWAFESCTSLTNITIPNSVTTIGDYAFQECTGLADVTIPSSVTNLGAYAFYYCISLTNIIVPNSVTSIGIAPFFDCGGLTAITVDAQNTVYTSANGVLFDKNQTTLIEYPGGKLGSYAITNSITSIGDRAFEFCTNLINLTIPNSVTNIGDYAFENCDFLASANIPDGVTGIGEKAFYGSGLTNVTIPNSVTSIGDEAFDACFRLTAITVGAQNSFYSSVNGILFDKNQTTLIQYPAHKGGSYTIPTSVTNVGDWAFAYCSLLSALYFQGNVPTIGGNVFYGNSTTVYYLPGTTGWGSIFGGRPAVLWNPHATALGRVDGMFGFTIIGPTNATIVVEASTNLANPAWLPVSTNTLSLGASSFIDSRSAQYRGRFYRFRSP